MQSNWDPTQVCILNATVFNATQTAASGCNTDKTGFFYNPLTLRCDSVNISCTDVPTNNFWVVQNLCLMFCTMPTRVTSEVASGVIPLTSSGKTSTPNVTLTPNTTLTTNSTQNFSSITISSTIQQPLVPPVN